MLFGAVYFPSDDSGVVGWSRGSWTSVPSRYLQGPETDGRYGIFPGTPSRDRKLPSFDLVVTVGLRPTLGPAAEFLPGSWSVGQVVRDVSPAHGLGPLREVSGSLKSPVRDSGSLPCLYGFPGLSVAVRRVRGLGNG